MKKKKIEETMGRINTLLKENPRLILLDCDDARIIVKHLKKVKNELKAYKEFLDLHS